MAVLTRFKRHRQFEISRFSATADHGRGKRTCKTGSVFEPSDRKTSPDDATADTSAGRIGMNADSFSSTVEKKPDC